MSLCCNDHYYLVWVYEESGVGSTKDDDGGATVWSLDKFLFTSLYLKKNSQFLSFYNYFVFVVGVVYEFTLMSILPFR